MYSIILLSARNLSNYATKVVFLADIGKKAHKKLKNILLLTNQRCLAIGKYLLSLQNDKSGKNNIAFCGFIVVKHMLHLLTNLYS
jgi:hypothetical protein